MHLLKGKKNPIPAPSEEEKQEIREQIAEYKSYAPIIQNGLYYRLSNPTTEEICAWEFVHTDEKEQSKVLLNIVMQVIRCHLYRFGRKIVY